MGLIIFFLIWYFAYARNNPKIFEKLKKKSKLETKVYNQLKLELLNYKD